MSADEGAPAGGEGGNEPITIRVRDQVRSRVRLPRRSQSPVPVVIFERLFSFFDFSRRVPLYLLLNRLEKRLSSRLKRPRKCKRYLTLTLNERAFRLHRYVSCWTESALNQPKHQRCLNWMIKIKLIACWSRREVAKQRTLYQAGKGSVCDQLYIYI